MQAIWRRPRAATVADQRAMLLAAYREPAVPEEIPIRNGRGVTLDELGRAECRWPISAPGADEFCFCGNAPVEGLPYCLGHARLAYRPAGRARSA
jgi:GcrA cell cycle regulator